MKKSIELRVLPKFGRDEEYLKKTVRKKLKINPKRKVQIDIMRRSVDARKTPVVFVLRLDVYIDSSKPTIPGLLDSFKDVSQSQEVHIIGTGPAGYFAALKLIEKGLKPIIFERGKDVRSRRRDLRAIQQFHEVNPDSNYCFGEGGAGTYSDGKLYTRSHKRGNIQEILQLLVEHGATEDIMIDAHPHIGSNKLPKIITRIRETIESRGGEVHFGSKLTDIEIEEGILDSIEINHDTIIPVSHLILATGHSARDIFEMLQDRGVVIEAKPFAIGIRIEHPQQLIDSIQYKQAERDPDLPAAAYNLVTQVDGDGVFSFCMCPGGLVVPSATAPGEIVVNGMSMSRRDSKFANSGIVTSIEPTELEEYQEDGVFAGLHFQEDVEHMMFDHEHQSQKAPAQRMTDFIHGQLSTTLAETSYIPGLRSEPLHDMLPPFIYERLRKGLLDFGRKLKGYVTSEANVIGVESRTSSPIRITRD
ncbi:MAG: FAD-binding protein, partial [Bacteroidia bacterium]|nr:FAD-binding protein [Bacteroidia bacterium]